ncbi:MAG: cyclase family protein [Coxiellaceae bacterium]|nr:cyclase family protein [Coxiellaceae bacterium]
MKPTIDFEKSEIIDLTHSVDSNIPTWEEGCGFQSEITMDYHQSSTETPFRVQSFHMRAGIGTHMDAPAHCVPNGKTIDQIAIHDLMKPCILIDVSEKADADYLLLVEDIITFENKHGKIAPDLLVIVHTGWSRHWADPVKYRNQLQFPSVSKEAAELLLRRNIAGLGIDTLSPDTAKSGFPVHQLLLSSNKIIIENLHNTDLLRPVGAYIIALPIKVYAATEAPLRIIAIQDK